MVLQWDPERFNSIKADCKMIIDEISTAEVEEDQMEKKQMASENADGVYE